MCTYHGDHGKSSGDQGTPDIFSVNELLENGIRLAEIMASLSYQCPLIANSLMDVSLIKKLEILVWYYFHLDGFILYKIYHFQFYT